MPTRPMEGLRVIEVAGWSFVPAAGAVLADWGADVSKVEHPVGGDPQRNFAAHSRFNDAGSRAKNAAECVAKLDAEFANRTLADAIEMLDRQQGPWAVHQRPLEVSDDVQIAAHGTIQPVEAGDGSPFHLIANPVQFDEEPAHLTRAPVFGEHTEQILLGAGHTWDDLVTWKGDEVIS